MRSEPRITMPQQPEPSELHEILSSVFGLPSLDVGQVEWLLDRLERRSGGRAWA